MTIGLHLQPAQDVDYIRGYPVSFGVADELSYVEIAFETVR